MNYFVTELNGRPFCDPALFESLLRSNWQVTEASAADAEDVANEMVWAVLIEGRRLDGSLTKSALGVVLDGDVNDCARFAKWMGREFSSAKLSFCDEAYSANVELTPQTSAEELARHFG